MRHLAITDQERFESLFPFQNDDYVAETAFVVLALDSVTMDNVPK